MNQTPPTRLHGAAGSTPVASRQPPEATPVTLLQHLAGTERVPGDVVRVAARDRSFARQAQAPLARSGAGS
jgi:hypothetical protein